MIETDYHILPEEVYQELIIEAQQLNVSIDYFLMEFCKIDD
jgi:hypothetical protein